VFSTYVIVHIITIPLRRRGVLELLEERINEEISAREYRRDLLMTLLDDVD
jgi:hypothetical protein